MTAFRQESAEFLAPFQQVPDFRAVRAGMVVRDFLQIVVALWLELPYSRGVTLLSFALSVGLILIGLILTGSRRALEA